jgi:hypothetical protein
MLPIEKQKSIKNASKSRILLLSIIFYVLVTVVASMICLSQTGLFDNYTVWAQAVPLIPIHSGNATLDQGLPVFYDCLEEIVDESFSEQEDNYFQDEPRKSEVVKCYYEVFVNDNNDDNDDNTSDTDESNDNNEDSEVKEEEEMN